MLLITTQPLCVLSCTAYDHRSRLRVATPARPARQLGLNQRVWTAFTEVVNDHPAGQFDLAAERAGEPQMLDLATRVIAIREIQQDGEARESWVRERSRLHVDPAHRDLRITTHRPG